MNFSNNGSVNYGAVFLNGVTLTGTFSHNCYYKSGENNVARDTITGEMTLTQWQSNHSQDTIGTINSDPLLTDPANGDFTLQAGSPCINAGTDVGLTQDYEGNSVPDGNAPDIGVYEYQGSIDGIYLTIDGDILILQNDEVIPLNSSKTIVLTKDGKLLILIKKLN